MSDPDHMGSVYVAALSPEALQCGAGGRWMAHETRVSTPAENGYDGLRTNPSHPSQKLFTQFIAHFGPSHRL